MVMNTISIENKVGALALALSDAVLSSAQGEASEDRPAVAAIALLGHEPGMTIDRLRRALRISHPGAVRLVDRLVARGIAERKQSETDRRAVSLFLTNTGKASCTAILTVRQERIAQVLEVLSPDECKTLEALSDKLLRKLVRNLDQAYSACRLCDPKACQDCPCRSRGVDEL